MAEFDKRVAAAVMCTECGVGVGERCVQYLGPCPGMPTKIVHAARIRAYHQVTAQPHSCEEDTTAT